MREKAFNTKVNKLIMHILELVKPRHDLKIGTRSVHVGSRKKISELG